MDQWLCMPGALIWLPLTGEEHVEQMMQAHKRRKKCPLYVVRNGPPSDNIVDAMSKEGQFYRTSIHGPIEASGTWTKMGHRDERSK